MKAVGYRQSLPIDDPASLEDLEPARPGAGRTRPAGAGEGDLGEPGRHQGAQGRRARGRQAKVLGWDAVGTVEAVGAAVSGFQARRPRVLRRLDHPARHQQRAARGRRTHRGARAEEPGRRAGRRAAADHHHRLRVAVRPAARAEGRRRRADAADRRRRRRRRLDPDPARAPAHAAARDRHRLAHRDARVVPGARRARGDRPFEAAGRRAEGGRHRRGRHGRQPDADRASTTRRSSKA